MQIFDLEAITEHSGLVLVDTDLQSRGRCIQKEIYNMGSFDEIDSRGLLKNIGYLKTFIKILNIPNVRTVPEVAEELLKFAFILGEKLVFLTQKENELRSCSSANLPKKKASEVSRHRALYNKSELNSGLLNRLQGLAYTLSQISRQNQLEFDNPHYSGFFNIMKDTAKLLGIEASDTDIHLAATLYWTTMFSSESNSLISNDHHIFELYQYLPIFLSGDIFSPFNTRFNDHLYSNPPHIFKRKPTGFEEIPTLDMLEHKYRISTLTLDKKGVIRAINSSKEFWKTFYEAYGTNHYHVDFSTRRLQLVA
ncbi:MAG: hypothetical protein Q8N99_05355 [Nanoarchaeota archaeon]|nr:hypothetical protein [Nanoarchaeota archaeon]